MIRPTAAVIAATLAIELLDPAACARAQAAGPFRPVPIQPPVPRNHAWAYATLASGAGLVGLSFMFSQRADDAYADYLVSTDPDQIENLYDRAARNDHLSQASLLTGEALVAAGLYLRFIRRPGTRRVSLSLRPTRWVASYRF